MEGVIILAFEPNEEQVQFLESRNSNVLVSASAGSGKTSTMIQKLMQILTQDKLPISNLLVLTFTDAAASEIKQKLFISITEKIESGEDQAFLKKQLDNINSAEIGTLHSVCKKMIVKYFYEINQSPDFKLLTERESKYLIDMAMNNVFERYIESNDSGFFDLYECYNSKRNETNLKKIILSLFNYLRNKSDYKNWIEKCTSHSFNENLNENSSCMFLYNYALEGFSGFKGDCDALIDIAKSNDCFGKYLDFLYQKRQMIDEILNAKNFIQMQKIIFNLATITKPRKSSKDDVDIIDFDERVDYFNKQFSETIKNIKGYFVCDSESDTIQNINSSKINVDKLITIVEDVWKEYNNKKKVKNSLDFNDLEDKMLELLNNEKVAKILKANYQFVFFDEYQDINEKQELILSKLVSGDNYYMIGDVKQSIYAFRQSSPKIFVSKFYKFSEDGIKNKVINFNKNYRSDKNILEFDNIVFDKLITEKTIGINYEKNSRFQSKKYFSSCHVDMRVIDTNQSEDGEEDVDVEEKEALLVADTISDLLSKKKENGEFYTYRDIAIILRKRGTFIKTLCDTLTSMQIPINATISSDFFNSFEINLMMAISQVGCNYKEDIALTTVLKWLFNIGDEQLLKIRNINADGNFYDCVKDYSEQNEIKEKLKNFFEFLDIARGYISKHTTKEYLQMVINRFDLLRILKSMPNGKERVQNVNEFLSLSDNDNYKYNLDKFVEYLQFVSTDNQLQNIGSVGNAVQIMTIHYSKGLEYPAVILAGLGKKFNINKDTSDIIINENLGVGLKAINSSDRTLKETIVRNACKIDNKKSEMNEEIRLLYVAMTRPKERLIMVGTYKLDDFEKNKNKETYLSKNYLDLIFKCVPDIYNSNFLNRNNFVLNEDKDSCCNIEFLHMEDIITKSLSDENKVIIDDAIEVPKLIDKQLRKEVNTQTFTIKNTVTNILKEEKDYENINYCPENLNSSDRVENVDALKLGTAYHSVMQNLKFTEDEDEDEIEKLLDKLQNENVISKEYANLIDKKEIFRAKEILKDIVLGADKVYKEKQFIMQQNYNKIVKNSDNNTKIIIQGIIDLVVIKDGQTFLIDYKTNRTKNEDLLIKNYALQLDIYSQAFEKATNIAVNKKFLYSFYMGKLIEVI